MLVHHTVLYVEALQLRRIGVDICVRLEFLNTAVCIIQLLIIFSCRMVTA